MRRLIVQIPDFEYLPGGVGALPVGLERLLARAEYWSGSAGEVLARSLGLEALPSAGALSRLSFGALEEEDRRRCWLRFDAVGMVPDLTSVWLENPIAMDFGAPELRDLSAELQAMFEHRGLDWWPSPGAGFGLLGLDAPPAAELPGLEDVPGQRLDQVLPTGPEAARWSALINESQMIFHQFRSLARADQRGAGLWFWGPGIVPETPAVEPVRLVERGSDALLRGLTVWLDAETIVAQSFSDLSEGEGAILLRWPLSDMSERGDPSEALRRLHQRWLGPAMGRIEVDVIGTRGAWRLRPMDRWRFWRRARPAGFGDLAR